MDTYNLKIVFFGTPDFVIPVLQKLQENFNVVAVVTAPDKKVGRKQLLTASPVKQFYQSLVFEAKKGPSRGLILTLDQFTPDVAQRLNNLHPDLFVVAAFGKIIPKNILEIPKFGALNIHPSLLPKYRGPSPIQSAILNGDKVSGVSVIKMDEKIDHGPIIYAMKFRLSNQDNFQTLSTKMFARSTEVLIKIIPAFVSGKLKLKEQNHNLATFSKMIKKEDGYFDINNPPPPEKLNRMIRAYYPWPGTWTLWNPQPQKAQPCEARVVKFLPNNMIQLEGKKPISLEDFLNGYPSFPFRQITHNTP